MSTRSRSTEPSGRRGKTSLPPARSNTSMTGRNEDALMAEFIKFKSMGKTRVNYDNNVPLSKTYLAVKNEEMARRKTHERKDKETTSHAIRNTFGDALRQAVQRNGPSNVSVQDSVLASPSTIKSKSVTRPKIDSEGKRHETVDWSFMGLTSLDHLRFTEPRSGRRYKADRAVKSKKSQSEDERKAALRAEREEKERANNLYCFFEGKRSDGRTTVTGDGITILKAKGETYAFKMRDGDAPTTNDDDDLSLLEADKSKAWKIERMKQKMKERKALLSERIDWEVEGPTGEVVIQSLTGDDLALYEEQLGLFHCGILKCNNNSLTSILHISRALKGALYRPHRFLNVVDLSSNRIAELPDDMGLLVCLTSLLLHDNKLPLEELSKLRVFSKSLVKLTLFHNPLQDDLGAHYKAGVAAFLPTLRVLDNTPIPRDMTPLAMHDIMALTKRRRIHLPPI